MGADPLTQGVARPTPVLDIDTQSFWTGGKDGRLLIHCCAGCSYYVHPPTSFCPRCEGRQVAPTQVSGRGEIISMTVNHKQWLPGLKVPYIVAMVAIEEQADVHLISNIVDAPVDQVSIGDKVEVLFELADDVWAPLFRLLAKEG